MVEDWGILWAARFIAMVSIVISYYRLLVSAASSVAVGADNPVSRDMMTPCDDD